MYLIQGGELFPLLVDYIGMFAELLTYFLQYGCLFPLTGFQLRKNKRFQSLTNTIKPNCNRISGSYHGIQLFFLVMTDGSG